MMDNRPYWAFMAIVLALVWIIDACTPARAAVSVSPAVISTGSASWWSGFTAVSNATGAQVTKGVTASLLSSLGASNTLSATVSTLVPRSRIASGAAAVLKRTPYGLAALALYPLVSSYLSSDGQTLTQQGTPTDPTGTGFCNFAGGNRTYSSCYSLAQTGINGFYGFVWSAGAGMYYACGYSCYAGWTPPGSGQCTAPATWLATNGKCVPSEQIANPTEGQIATAIQNSSTPSHDLFVAEMNDIIANKGGNIDFGAEVIPKTQAASISASPVTTPEETVSVTTSPNPDGSTTTTTKKQQTTATPVPKGSTVGDIGIDWQTSTTTTQTAHNNTAGTDAVTTTTEHAGTSTTAQPQQQSDLCQLHPEISACAQLGTVPSDTPPAVSTTPIPANFNPPATVAGSCPAPITAVVHPPMSSPVTLSISYQPVCDYSGMIRLIVLAAAYLSAAYIVSGSVRSDA